MSTASKSFTAVGAGPDKVVRKGEQVTYAVSGSFVGTVVLEQYIGGGWTALVSKTAAATGTVTPDYGNKTQARVRFSCSAYTSGTIVTAIADVTTEALAERRGPDGTLLERTTESGLELYSPRLTTPQGCVHAIETTFTETGAGTYTGAVTVPADATLLDVIVSAVALWDAATSAALNVGDGDDADGFYAAVDLKATDLLAGQSLSFSHQGGKGGAYFAGSNTHVAPRYSATARVISGVVTSVGAGTAGRTRMTVVYHAPATADSVTATKA
jgi:hypothetical protein